MSLVLHEAIIALSGREDLLPWALSIWSSIDDCVRLCICLVCLYVGRDWICLLRNDGNSSADYMKRLHWAHRLAARDLVIMQLPQLSISKLLPGDLCVVR